MNARITQHRQAIGCAGKHKRSYCHSIDKTLDPLNEDVMRLHPMLDEGHVPKECYLPFLGRLYRTVVFDELSRLHDRLRSGEE